MDPGIQRHSDIPGIENNQGALLPNGQETGNSDVGGEVRFYGVRRKDWKEGALLGSRCESRLIAIQEGGHRVKPSKGQVYLELSPAVLS